MLNSQNLILFHKDCFWLVIQMVLQAAFAPIKKLLIIRLGPIEIEEEVEVIIGAEEAEALGDDNNDQYILQKFKIHGSLVTLVFNPKVCRHFVGRLK
jgi:hypothetical protein